MERHSECVEFGFMPADPDGGQGTDAAEPVEGRDSLGQQYGVVQRQEGDQRAQSDALGRSGDKALRRARV